MARSYQFYKTSLLPLLVVDGWYSLNILGNVDGANLMDPARAAGKLSDKTNLLQVAGLLKLERECDEKIKQ
jgi:myo-inositol-1-phosphate synthase